MASHRPFSLNCPIQPPVFPLFWIGNLRDLQGLEYPSNGLANNKSTLSRSTPLFLLPSGYVPKQVEPAHVVIAFPRFPIKLKNMIIRKKPAKKSNLFFQDQETPAINFSTFIDTRDLQVLIIASEVDGSTSATQSLAPCTDLHCSFFRYLTCLSHSNFTA
jgi:hypothetical protein